MWFNSAEEHPSLLTRCVGKTGVQVGHPCFSSQVTQTQFGLVRRRHIIGASSTRTPVPVTDPDRSQAPPV